MIVPPEWRLELFVRGGSTLKSEVVHYQISYIPPIPLWLFMQVLCRLY